MTDDYVTPHERAAWRAESERQVGAPAVERILDRRILRLLDALEAAEARSVRADDLPPYVHAKGCAWVTSEEPCDCGLDDTYEQRIRADESAD